MAQPESISIAHYVSHMAVSKSTDPPTTAAIAISETTHPPTTAAIAVSETTDPPTIAATDTPG